MASDSYHEPYDDLSPATRDMHRAITTLIEELEAIDWYQQRAEACGNEELRAVILHNKGEEIEHAMMTLEWLRRNSPEFDAHLRTYVFSEVPITLVEKEKQAEDNGGGAPGPGGAPRHVGPSGPGGAPGLGIGSLKEG